MVFKIKKDIKGNRFGRLVVSCDTGTKTKSGSTYWKCLCDCGKTTIVSTGHLNNGSIKSCGCLKHEALRTHGLTKDPLYKTWDGMKQRCHSKNHEHYHLYGGRGISICNEWKNDFKVFYDWAMQLGWNNNLEIDRINNDGNYEPSNCRLVTRSANCRNRRNTLIINYENTPRPLKDVCEELNLKYTTVYARIKAYGYSVEKALSV